MKIFKKIRENRKTVLLMSLTLLVLLSFGVLYTLLQRDEVEAGWWDETWMYRKEIQITNSNSSDLEDFQVSFVIDTASLITSGKMESTCNDLRVTDRSGNILPHWIEENNPGCNSASTRVWVKVPTVYEGTNATVIYVYYGNSSANNIENGNHVFEFFDDFNENSIAQYNSYGHSTTWQITNGYLEVSNSDSTGYSYLSYPDLSYSNTESFVLDSRIYLADSAGWGGFLIFSNNNSSGHHLDYNIYRYSDRATSTADGTSNLPASSTWENTSMSYNGGNGTLKWYKNNTEVYSDPLTGSSGTSSGSLGFTSNYHNGSYRWDNIRVRKYSDLEPTTTPSTTEEVTPAPIAYWKFDEGTGVVAHDASGQGNDGTIYGSSWETDGSCVSGSCTRFDGVNEYINSGNQSSLNLTKELTISMWVYNQRELGKHTFLVRKAAGSGGYGIYQNTSELLSFFVYFPTGTPAYQFCDSGYSLPQNEWTHITALFKQDEYLKIFINGEEKNSCVPQTSGPIGLSGNDLLLGYQGWWGSDNAYFKGLMDEVKIYPYARTEDEIKSDYATGLSGIGSTLGASTTFGSYSPKWMSDGLVGYWKMDESSWAGVADEVIDHSGNSNHGTSYSGATTDTGKFGNSGSFDGVDDYVELSQPLTVFNSSFTVSMWAYFDDDTRGILLGDYQRPNAVNINFEKHTSGRLRLYWAASPDILTSDNVVELNKWQLITYVRDKENSKVYIYVDGVLVHTYNGALSDITTSGLHLIGRDNRTGTTTVDGSIDEVRIYNRALSPTEVKDLYKWAPGPIAHYTFDSGDNTTLNDISGYGNTGTWNGTTTERYTQGKIGKGGVFNGSDDYVNVPASESSILNISGNQITQSAWIYPTANVSNGTIATRNGGYYFQRHSDAKVAAYQYGTNPAGYHYSTGTVPLNEWSFVAYSYDGEYITFYINGSPSGRIAKTGDITQISSYLDEPFRIGWDSSTGARYFNGIIDDVRIYNYARTQSQILEDMRASGGPPEPIGYWSFDEGTGTTAQDSSGSGNHGTIMDQASWTSAGRRGKALQLDGLNGRIQDFPFEPFKYTGGDLSFSLWFNRDSTDSGQSYLITRPWNGSGQYNYRVQLSSDDSLYFALLGETSWSTTVASFTGKGVWTHLGITIDGITKEVKIYKNGEVVNSGLHNITNWTPTSGDSNLTMCIGTLYPYGSGWAGNTEYSFQGLVDEVKFYNTPLTPEQVLLDYNQGMTATLSGSPSTTGNVWGGSASSEYCIPGDTSTCNPPVGEWLFDENQGSIAKDTSGNGNDGTLVNSPSWSKGKEGAALSFNGVDQYVDGGNIGDISNSFSVSMYINPASFSSTSFPLNYQSGSDASSLTLRLQISTSGIISLGSYIPSIGSIVSANSSTTLQTGNWYKIDGTFDGTTLRIYIDGILETEVDSGGTPIYSINNKIGIGTRFIPGPNLHFPGLIDQVRIYDYARTPAQIMWDYNRGSPIGHWRFDECQGTTAHDVSGNNNHGTININGNGTQTSAGTCTSRNIAHAWYNGRNGKFESSLSFDGTDDWAKVDSQQLLDVHNSGEVTYSLWYYFTGNNVLLHRGSSSSDGVWTGCQYEPLIKTDAINLSGCSNSGLVTTFTSASGWNNLIIVFSEILDSAKVYLNSELIADTTITSIKSASDSSSLIFNAQPVATKITLGAMLNLGNPYAFFSGPIDDVRIYNYALTEAQIKLLYNDNSAVRF